MQLGLVLLSLFCFNCCFSQLNDKVWICGGPACRVTFDGSVIDTFRYIPHIYSNNYWANISDESGNLQFFTDGINAYSFDGSLMVNGNELADNLVNASFNNGLPDEQNFLILPKKGAQYYIVNQSVDDFNFNSHGWDYTTRLYYSVVDMDLQNGKGEVIQKKAQINSGNFMDGQLTACQHANGRDWWLVNRRYNFNSYFIYLVTEDSISLIREQVIGAVSQEPDAVGQAAFSSSGTKYASITGKSPLIVLDFDRCEGVFSNPQRINMVADTFMFFGNEQITVAGGFGVCFSPSERLVYVNNGYILRQYDLLQNPIDSTETIIFFWTDTNEQIGLLNQMHLGPNGKIYLAPFQGFTKAIHVINYPDSTGTTCDFVKWGLPISTNNADKLPNMIHFRMGELVGSGCDTITATSPNLSERGTRIRIFPNPANDIVEIDLMNYSQYHPLQQFYLYDVQGKLIKQVALPFLSAQLKISDLPAGVYHWKVVVREDVRGEGKLEVVK